MGQPPHNRPLIGLLHSWRQDRLLRQVLKNSAYLFSSGGIAAALGMLQGIFAVRLLGADGYGLVSGTVIVFASNIHRLFSFRMSEMVVRYLRQALADGNKAQAAAVVQIAAAIEALTSLLAYLVLLGLAPLAARYFAKDPATLPFFVIYGAVLLSNLVYETSTGVLQALRRFDRIAVVNLAQSIVTALLIGLIFWTQQMLHWADPQSAALAVLLAYLAGKTLAGLALPILAFQRLRQELGPAVFLLPTAVVFTDPHSPLPTPHSPLPTAYSLLSTLKTAPLGEMLRFAISTNLSGTINLIVRDSETLLISFFMNTSAAGYYRLAQSFIALVVTPIDPLIAPTYTEITRTIAQHDWRSTRRLLKRVSILAAGWTGAAALGLGLAGWAVIPWLYGAEMFPAYWVLMVLLLGYGVANTFQWNRPLLLALGKPAFPLIVAALAGLLKTLLSITLLPVAGYLAEAVILSAYFVVSVGVLVWRGLTLIQHQESDENRLHHRL